MEENVDTYMTRAVERSWKEGFRAGVLWGVFGASVVFLWILLL